MATTTNYSWTTPDDTDLVKDGAAAIRTLGSSIDTTTKALNPSTTLGDIEYRSSTANTNTRLGIGTTGQVLLVSGGVPAWGTPSSGGLTLISETVASALSSLTFGTISGSYKQLLLIWSGIKHSATGSAFSIRLNNNSGSVYGVLTGAQTTDTNAVYGDTTTQITSTNFSPFGINANSVSLDGHSKGYLVIDNYSSSTKAKTFYGQWNCYDGTAGEYRLVQSNNGTFNSTTAVTSIDIFRTGGSATFSNQGDTTIRLYGVA